MLHMVTAIIKPHMLESVKDALRAKATLGEISDALIAKLVSLAS